MVSRVCLLVGVAWAMLGFAPAFAGTAATPPACQDAAALEPSGRLLPHVADGLRAGGRLDILAVGAASMTATRAGPEAGFPVRTVAMLRAARPGADVRLSVRVERGASAGELLRLLKRELATHTGLIHPGLVLWQTGTIEAARDRPPAEFAAVLREGVQAAHDAGSDIVLIDPPYTRLLTAHADPGRYREAFADAAAAPGAAVFSRFALTRRWVELGVLDLERAPLGERAAALSRLHECLARALSQGLLAAAP